MSFLTKIFGKENDEAEIDAGPPPECLHGTMVAHWDRPEDMGSEDLASSWKCTSCGQDFSSDERELIHAAEEERVRNYQVEKAELEARAAAEPKVI